MQTITQAQFYKEFFDWLEANGKLNAADLVAFMQHRQRQGSNTTVDQQFKDLT